jgi:hypothetical protein
LTTLAALAVDALIPLPTCFWIVALVPTVAVSVSSLTF